MDLPPGLDWARTDEEGRGWLESLPTAVDACADRWQLRLGEPFPDSYVSLVLPATDAAGNDLVLKLQYPHRECEQEADALALWNGEGAIRLIAQDRDRHALLLERCRPGTPLSLAPAAQALDVLVELLPRLWRPIAGGLRALADEAAHWAATLEAQWLAAGRPCERALLDVALGALRDLPGSQGEQVLVHQDLHAGNVLRAEREPWLAIDPKPLAGEREFAVAPVVRSAELGHGRREVVGRLDRLTGDLGLDRERARLWTIAQTLAWGVGNPEPRRHIEAASWLAEAAGG
jgi:streptomycin 6-kinase